MVAAEAPPKPKRETWRDWLPDGAPEPEARELLTRDEFLNALRDRDVPITTSMLVHWERAGALPRAVRRWQDGAPRALYPEWLIRLAALIPSLQERGLPLREIGTHLRDRFRDSANVDASAGNLALGTTVVKVPTARAHAEALPPTVKAVVPGSLSGRARIEFTATGRLTVEGPTTGTSTTKVFAEDLAPALAALTQRYHQISGARVLHIEGQLVDERGTTLVFRSDLDHLAGEDRHEGDGG